jgi:hypothetical protein
LNKFFRAAYKKTMRLRGWGKMRFLRVSTILACACSLVCWGQPTPKLGPDMGVRPQSSVNWEAQVIRALGSGAPDFKSANPAQARLGAERAALNDALRSLLARLKEISIDSNKKMGDLMEKDETKSRIEALIREYKIVSKRYFSDSGVEVEIEIRLALLTDILDPDAAVVPASTVASPPSPTSTGVVIDARGLKARPALMPRLLDEAGKPLYSIDSLSADARKITGVVSYVLSLADARKSSKAGENPLFLKASKADGADVLLPANDAKKLAAIDASILASGRVVIVLN